MIRKLPILMMTMLVGTLAEKGLAEMLP